ncbi:unnamed protein product [Brassicogethes aeneus]|uniref:Uncharacterized protein n=1 Tax=Brassicogethes aeneus TaxID=1431903 RepID=A0A9P0BEY6_BRAAE|nr:unnamed protein product [Brassicogethes aeneus]
MNEKDSVKRRLVSRKKAPEVKQTLTSYRRLLNANPILQYQIEGKPLPVIKSKEPENLPQTINCSKNFNNVSKVSNYSIKKDTFKKPIINPKIEPSNTKSTVKNRYPNYLKFSSNLQKKNNVQQWSMTNNKRRSKSVENLTSQSLKNINIKSTTFETEKKTSNVNLQQSITTSKKRLSKSAENINNDESIVFKTPSAYERRSLACKTPMSTNRKSLFNHCSTPRLPTHAELQERLNKWLLKRGKSLSTYTHLKCFGSHGQKKGEQIDEENKENIEVKDEGSYEDLLIISKEETVSEHESEELAKTALLDLHQLILEGYNLNQCECWLQVIKQKYTNLDKDPQYWECRAAIEEARGNISQAVEYFQNAIVTGADVKSVDQSLDQLLEKFSLLDINTGITEEKKMRGHSRIVQDARNIFKSSIIKFAIQEKSLQQRKNETDKKLVVTPVRRSTRLSRSNYVSTPGVQLYSSLREISDDVSFQSNNALC